MGNAPTKPDTPNANIRAEFKKDSIIKTTLKTANFRFALHMKATKEEGRRLNESWKDFLSGVKESFIYYTETKYPQYIKITRVNNKIQFSITTTVQMEEEDLDNLTQMFSKIEHEIRNYDTTAPSGLIGVTNSSSSLNLLIPEE